MKLADIQILSVGELLRREFPATDSMLGNGLIDRGGVILISGPQKIGKSLFGTQLAFALASQTPFLGFDAGGKNYKTLILQAEVNEKRMKDRFLKQVSGFPEASRDQVLSASVFSEVKLDSEDSVAVVHDWLGAVKPDLLIIDPLSNFHGGDENVAKDMLKITNTLDRFRADGVAVAVVHHHGKGSAARENVGHKLRGSTLLAGWYDSHLSLEWAGPPNVRLRFELRHDEIPEDKIIRMNPATLQFEVKDDEGAQISLVISTVREIGSATADQVADQCHRTRQWASDWLNRATDQDKLIRSGKRPVIFSLPGEQAADFRVEIPNPLGGQPIVVSTNTAGGLDVQGPEVDWLQLKQ